MKRTAFEQRVEHWRALLIPEWRLTVIVDATHLDDDRIAEVAPDDDYLHAEVAFTRLARKQSSAEVDATIAHELLHCLTREYRRILDHIAPNLSKHVADLVLARYLTEEERLVERLARTIAGAQVYGTA